MRIDLCVCAEAPGLDLRTQVLVIMHFREVPLTTNTARWATLALKNAEIRVRGLPEQPLRTEDLGGDAREWWVLYPDESAEVMDEEWVRARAKPVTLIVPDGNWAQAKKAFKREMALQKFPRVKLPPGPPSKYWLRAAPRPEALSTYEAIARAMGALEGPPVQEKMEKLFDLMVERTLMARGQARGLDADGVREQLTAKRAKPGRKRTEI
jgi:DTW domain-containing protein YfiP